jgi:hypothetical protein
VIAKNSVKGFICTLYHDEWGLRYLDHTIHEGMYTNVHEIRSFISVALRCTSCSVFLGEVYESKSRSRNHPRP